MRRSKVSDHSVGFAGEKGVAMIRDTCSFQRGEIRGGRGSWFSFKRQYLMFALTTKENLS